MSAICICGVCIPYNAVIPVLLLLLKPIWEWIKKMLGMEGKVKSDDKIVAGEQSCCSSKDKCEFKQKKKSGSFPKKHFYLDKAEDLPLILEDACCTILKFTAQWCKPCKKIEPLFDSLSESSNYSTVNFVSVDVDKHEEIAAANHVVGIPLFVFYRGTKEFARMQGADETELKEFLAKSCSC